MTITKPTVALLSVEHAGDLNAMSRALSSTSGQDTRTCREAICTTMGWRLPGRYACRSLSRGQGRSERGRHRV